MITDSIVQGHKHAPVLLRESVDQLDVQDHQWYIDATFGRGGHTREILDRGGNVLAIDQDKSAIEYGTRNFVRDIESGSLLLVRENFEYIDRIVEEKNKQGLIKGILADFGVSSPQLDDASRGFSFQEDAPLDMRMDDRLGVKASDLVNALGKNELYEVLTTFSQEHHARIIVDAILRARRVKPIQTTKELATIIEKVVRREGRLHPATKTFQALRIVVNDELGSIERFLPRAFALLQANGRLVTISFHEGEDRLVKRFEVDLEARGEALLLTKKPIEAGEHELEQNMRARSGKLRAIEKIV